MPAKRSSTDAGLRDGNAQTSSKKAKKGFSKIKNSLIQKAKIKDQYSKIQRVQDTAKSDGAPQHTASLEPLPEERNTDLQKGKPTPNQESAGHDSEASKDEAVVGHAKSIEDNIHPSRRRKPQPFKKDLIQADRRKEELEARRRQQAVDMQQRQQKIAERERFRKAMAKARSAGQDGQRKLGRESKILLEKIQRMQS